jgi:hypothetical protein
MEIQELPEWSSPETIKSELLPPSSPALKPELFLRCKQSVRRHDLFIVIIFLLSLIAAIMLLVVHVVSGS